MIPGTESETGATICQRQMRNSWATDSAHKLQEATSQSKAYSVGKNIFKQSSIIYLQQLFKDNNNQRGDPNTITDFCSYFMAFQGTVERTTRVIKNMINVPYHIFKAFSIICKFAFQ